MIGWQFNRIFCHATKGGLMNSKRILFLLFLVLILAIPSPSITQTRDSNKVYQVAILPFLIHSQENLDYLREGIYDILSSRVTVEGRIEVVERSAVERALYEERPMRIDEAVAAKIGQKLGADYVVLGSITKVGDYISLDARLISITEGKPPLGVYTQHKGIDDVMVKIGDFAQDIGYKILGRRAMAGRSAERKFPSFAEQHRGAVGRIGADDLDYKRSQSFSFGIKGLDIGDVDGDGENEVVIMDSHNLYVFKYDGEKLNLFQKIEAGDQNNFLTLDVADLNRNGHAEIIVTSVMEDNLRSFILEYEEGKFRKITEKAGWYFRVLDHPKDGPILMGQGMGSEGEFVGPIYRFVWKKKSFEKGPKMPFPTGTKIFGLTVADIRGMGKNDLILFDKNNRLTLIPEIGKGAWTSGESFGETSNFYETQKKKPDAFRPQEAPPWRVYIPPRILVKDLTGDGTQEVIVSKNGLSGLLERVKSYDKGEIYDLIWDSGSLITNWKSREIKGYIADFQIKPVGKEGTEELVLAVVVPDESSQGISGLLSEKKYRSSILFFKLF